MCAYFHDVIYHTSKVNVEDVQKVSLLGHVQEQLIVLNVVTLNGLIRIKMLLHFIDTLLQCVKSIVTDFTQV